MTIEAVRTGILTWTAAGVLATVVGCEKPSPVQTVAEQTPVPDEPSSLSGESVRVIRSGVPHRVIVVAGQSRPGAEAVAAALGQALRRRGVQVVDDEVSRADLVVAAWCVTQTAGSWGGIPSQQVLLRYALLDVREESPIATGVDSASYADPSPASAAAGALRRAADNVARKVLETVRGLPAPAAKPIVDPPSDDVSPPVSVAALPFHNATGQAAIGGWCETLAAIAAQELTASGLYRVVERARLGEILKEDDLGTVFGATPDALADMGRRLGVKLLLVGEVSVRPDGQLSLTARFVQAADAEVRQVILATAAADRVDDLERQFRRQLPKPTPNWLNQAIEQLRRMPDAWPTGPSR